MTFVRTQAGLNNIHRFYDVDVVVFVEGGLDIRKSMLDDESRNLDTDDVFFWQRVLARFHNLRFHIKSVGSKSNLLQIAHDAIEADIRSILICVDRDFGEDFENLEQDPRVVLTWGYSWENDVLQLQVVESVLFSLVVRNAVAQEVAAEIFRRAEEFVEKVTPYLALDRDCLVRSEAGVFDRAYPKRILILTGTDAPILREDLLLTQVQDALARINLVDIVPDPAICEEGHRFIFGHLWASWMYHLFKNAIKRLRVKSSLRDSEFFRLSIDSWDRLVLCDSSHPVHLHFAENFASVLALYERA